MVVKASFGDVTWEDIQGYRIRARVLPERGIQDQFYVYIINEASAAKPLQPIAFPQDAGVSQATLKIRGTQPSFTYTFERADLRSVNTVVTRRRRFQMVEFQLMFDVAAAGEAPEVKLEHEGKNKVAKDQRLKTDYRANGEELLAFEGLVTRDRHHLFSFAFRRNSGNSWVQMAYDIHKDVKGATDWSKEVTGFSALSNGLKINGDTLHMMIADESWGVTSFLETAPALEFINDPAFDVRLSPRALTLAEYNEHSITTDHRLPDGDKAVDRGMFVMQQTDAGPNYDDIGIS